MELLFNLDKYYSDEERLIRDGIADFGKKELSKEINKAFEEGYFATSLVPQFAEMGLFGINLPKPYGIGASKIAYGLACAELEKIDSAFRSFISVQNSLVMYPIYKFGSDEQKSTYLPELSTGKMLGCFALTEPDHGSDPNGMETYAKTVSDGWILNGSKAWITNAPIANIIICWANTDNGIRGFLIDRNLSGITINEMKHKMSLRASITGEISFDNVKLESKALLPGTSIGLVAALKCLTQARFGICFGAIGAAMVCFEIALNYSKDRKQFGKSISSFQLIQSDLVNMYCKAPIFRTVYNWNFIA